MHGDLELCGAIYAAAIAECAIPHPSRVHGSTVKTRASNVQGKFDVKFTVLLSNLSFDVRQLLTVCDITKLRSCLIVLLLSHASQRCALKETEIYEDAPCSMVPSRGSRLTLEPGTRCKGAYSTETATSPLDLTPKLCCSIAALNGKISA